MLAYACAPSGLALCLAGIVALPSRASLQIQADMSSSHDLHKEGCSCKRIRNPLEWCLRSPFGIATCAAKQWHHLLLHILRAVGFCEGVCLISAAWH